MLKLTEALIYGGMSVLYFQDRHTPRRRVLMGLLALSLAVTNLLDAGDMVWAEAHVWVLVLSSAYGALLNDPLALGLSSHHRRARPTGVAAGREGT